MSHLTENSTRDAPANPTSGRAYLAAAAFVAAALAALAVDLPLARYCRDVETATLEGNKAFKPAKKLLTLAEVFGHGLGVALVCLAWFALDRERRWSLPRVLACSYGSGLTADLLKALVARRRPNSFDLSGGISDTFVGLLPVLKPEQLEEGWNRAVQSLPSGHCATAVGLAVVFGSFYPHARWLFVLLALLAMLQRLESGSHFLSDTLAGAAVGCLVAGLCLDSRFLGRFFARLEGDRRR